MFILYERRAMHHEVRGLILGKGVRILFVTVTFV
jgi:hypothetical protein